MSGTQVQWRGGTTAEHATFTGAAREVTVDTAKKTLVVHDGVTAGGLPLAREDLSNVVPATARTALSVYAKSEIDARQTTFRNLLVNGDMSVAQRGTSFAVSNAALYTLDRWYVGRGAANFTVQQSAPTGTAGTGIVNALLCQRTPGDTSTVLANIGQSVETANSKALAGRQVTLSFSANCGATYSPVGSGLSVYIFTGTGTDQNLQVGFTGSLTILSTAVPLTAAFTRFSYTATVPSNATQVGVMFSYTPTGTAGAADWFQIANVQLEAGSMATPFEALPYDVQLARCQRFARALPKLQTVCSYSNGTISGYVLPTGALAPMRATPTVVKDVGGATTLALANGTGAVTFALLNPSMADAQTFGNFGVATLSTALTAGQSYTLTNLFLSAEL